VSFFYSFSLCVVGMDGLGEKKRQVVVIHMMVGCK
jgi:hypothetical protein